ncbi:J domain-containing protein [Pedobacter sp. MC2016-24]|uniref:J domain-containing protein n=1 Tax=Pedobacter sp. MC2016-24 TaxID=2780090 RepID=UPI001880EF5E|nr:J domain-containing protein [Pedobacter sp. MC2016-24]MBE9598690.1 J domain-containing protein [Pedobacter sp. MC2016-24]
MKFFNDCTTLDEVKAKYKKLALEHHPDRGGDTATMQAINAEYAFASARILKGANLSEEDTEKEIRFSEEYRKIIEQIVNLEGIVIELVGLWIWVTGQTYPVRAELKTAGLFFAPKKQAWYYRSEDLKETRGGKKSLEEIRSKYGSEVVNQNRYKAIN